jgi:integrase
MDGSALYRRYLEIQKAAGVRALRFHDLRHTFGTQAIASGAHVNDVKEWMGHRHLSTTMRYVHPSAAPRGHRRAGATLHRGRRGARRTARCAVVRHDPGSSTHDPKTTP